MQQLGARILISGNKTGDPVLLDDNIIAVVRDDLFDLDVFMPFGQKEMGAVLPNPLILGRRKA